MNMDKALAEFWQGGALPALGRVSIRLRIAVLVVLALSAAAAFAAVYAYAAHRTNTALAAQDGFGRLNDLAAEAQARSLAVQVEAEQFLRERDTRFATAFHADAARLAELVTAMRAIPQAAPEAGRLTELAEDARQLAEDFDHLVAEAERLGLSEKDGLRGQLRASVQAIEDELKMWPNAAPLMVDMLHMRQAEKDFMLYGTERLLGNHVRYANQFDFAIDATTLAPSTRADFRRLLTTYTEDMKAFGAGTLALAAEIDRLRARQAAIRPLVEEVFAFAHAGMARAIAEQEKVRAETLAQTSAIGLLGVVVFTLAAMLIAMSIVRPLRLIEQAMKALADGDHTVEIPGRDRTDEIGDMAQAVAVFKQNAEAVARMHLEREQVRHDAEATSRRRVLSLAQSFEDTVKSVAELVATKAVAIHETAGGIAGDGGNRNAWSLTVAEAAEQARHTVEAVTVATELLSASVDEVAGHGAEVAQAVGTAMSELSVAEDRVRGLAEIAGRIDHIVALIGDIAQRTNMLSLNATIEAQRAGLAGQGFAVVAGEVKRLAGQTADSARDIAHEIAAIQTATGDTVQAIGGIGDAIRAMDALATVVQGAVGRQSEVTRVIERCVADVTAETRVLSEGVTGFTHSAAQQCGAAAQVLWAAEDLSAPTRALKDEVDSFLSTVRADSAAAA